MARRFLSLTLTLTFLLTLGPALVFPAAAEGTGVFYVTEAGGSETKDGLTWDTAFADVQVAIEACKTAGGEVRIAEGTYVPTTNPNNSTGATVSRLVHFSLRNGVTVIGGFAGTETGSTPRGGATILSGDLGTQNDNTDNAYHVFYHPDTTNLNATAVLQNVTISGGNANDSTTTTHRMGGGMYNSSSSPTITNCAFTGNEATIYGGGMYNFSSSPTTTNCTFTGNSAPQGNGGGMYNHSSSPTISHTIISGNTGGNVRGDSPTYSYSIDGTTKYGVNNSDNTPTTVTIVNPDGTLPLGSPAIDAGDPSYTPAQLTDLAGNPRVWGRAVDIGAYELPYDQPLYVSVEGGANGKDGKSWDTAFSAKHLQYAIDLASAWSAANGNQPAQVYIAEGTYVPTTNPNNASGTSAVPARLVHFSLRNGVTVIGGFAGTETGSTPRGGATILSGDLDKNDSVNASTGAFENRGDNAYHVFCHPSTTNLDATAVLQNVTISGGNANDEFGAHAGGGGMHNNSSSPTITSCTFTNNSANSGGGMSNSSASPTITNCMFTNNSANGGGGILNSSSSSPTITNCTFTNNSANGDYSYGGGMHNSYSSPTITNCAFTDNSAATNGGGMYNLSTSSPTDIPIITNCTFTGNSAATNGGGMYNGSLNPSTNDPIITNCTFTNNSANSGGGMYNASSAPSISHTIISGNTSGNVSSTGGNPIYAHSILGLNLSNVGEDIAATATEIVNPDGTLPPGSPAIDAGNPIYTPTQLTDLAGNPRVWGRAVDIGAYELPYDQPLYVSVEGGANGKDGKSWDTAFSAKRLQYAIDLASAWSAANGNQPAQVYIAEGTYVPTTNPNNASGTSAVPARLVHFSLRNGVTVIGGFAGTETGSTPRGGATILSGDVGAPNVNTDNAYHVFYHPDGTGINATAVLQNVTISGGNASNLDGGGMYNSSSSPTITNCTFTGNSATSFGGGMYNSSSSPTITNCTFTGNSANNAGGGMCNNSSSPTVSNCAFTGNSATYYGGGMLNGSSSSTITNCTFTGNSANDNGGGMSCGGGMYIAGSSTTTITNCTFTGNSANNDGGGMYISGSSPNITNCTFTGNSAVYYGGGMYIFSSSPTISHTIISGNTRGDVYNSSGSPTYAYSILGTDFVTGTTGTTPTNKTTAEIVSSDGTPPLGSPAIDGGDPTPGDDPGWQAAWTALKNAGLVRGVTVTLSQLKDLAGNPRASGSAVDIGAYEYQPPAPPRDRGGGSAPVAPVVHLDTSGVLGDLTVNPDGTVERPADPLRAGYAFTGWYLDRELTKPFDFGTKITEEITLFPGWVPLAAFPGFTDTAGHWAQGVIDNMAAKGILHGYEDGSFRPDRPITRAEFLTILMGSLKPEPTGLWMVSQFADVPQGAYYWDNLLKAKAMGIVTGDEAGHFNPNQEISRQDMFVMVYRALEVLGKLPEFFTMEYIQYSDSADISPYANQAIQNLSKLDLIHGDGGAVKPLAHATRAEAAQFFWNLLDYLG